MTRRVGQMTRRASATAAVALLAVVMAAASGFASRGLEAANSTSELRIFAPAPLSLDPAIQGDSSSSAVTAQLFESLTAFDSTLTLRPALARAWDVLDGGRRVVFHLRTGAAFSDGTPLTAGDVVRSWLRVIDPTHPSPLANLLDDVDGAEAYRLKAGGDPASVGLHADGLDLTVNLVRPAADFPSVVSSPTFGIVPAAVVSDPSAVQPGRFVGSGGYILGARTKTELTLTANARYWAGPPAIATVHLVTDIGGQSPVSVFEAGDLDYAPIGGFDASWIRYDRTLGPQLRSVPTLSVQYLGFDTSRPPFDDVRVRRAFGAAVDWQRIVNLGGAGIEIAATSMIPPGIEGRSSTNFLPLHDPAAARSLIAEAGYPGGKGFPTINFVSDGAPFAAAIRADLKRELGISVGEETLPSADFFRRLATEPPPIWALGWIADYPGPNDFLGILLRTGATNDYGRWSSPEFDSAITKAGASTDQAAIAAAFDQAQALVQRDVPVVPLAYSTEWALSRQGLLGAGGNGLGFIRLAGLAWSGK
jgi:oligopeptide transport system substrate-binding protein